MCPVTEGPPDVQTASEGRASRRIAARRVARPGRGGPVTADGVAASVPYQDQGLAIDQRVEDLLARMEVADKAGMLFHSMAVFGDPWTVSRGFGIPSLASMVTERRMNHFNVFGTPADAREFAAWSNAAQRITLARPLAIPITFSTDPRQAFTDNPGTAMLAGPTPTTNREVRSASSPKVPFARAQRGSVARSTCGCRARRSPTARYSARTTSAKRRTRSADPIAARGLRPLRERR